MTKIFADGASSEGIIAASKNKNIMGFTTNPSLMRAASVTDYESFARDMIAFLANTRPETSLSLEVFADDYNGMVQQAQIIDGWGREHQYRVYVKIPVVDTRGESTGDVIHTLSNEGIPLNITAVMTTEQVEDILLQLNHKNPSIISIFAGRIADAGYDPVAFIDKAMKIHDERESCLESKIQFLWASTREAYNYMQALDLGVDIITMTPDLIKKTELFGKNLTDYSRETVQMFYNDAVASGYKINV